MREGRDAGCRVIDVIEDGVVIGLESGRRLRGRVRADTRLAGVIRGRHRRECPSLRGLSVEHPWCVPVGGCGRRQPRDCARSGDDRAKYSVFSGRFL